MSFLSKLCHSVSCAFPTPKYLSFSPVGIDISHSAVRMMELEKSSFGLVPKRYDEIVFNRVCNLGNDNLVLEDIAEVVNSLIALKKKHKIRNVVCSLPEQKTYIFKIKVPKEAISDVASSIRYQLEENVPIPAVDANFDYFILENGGHADHYEVVVSVFPKKIIETYTKILRKAGLEPISFQSESVALSRAVIRKGDHNPYLLVRMMPTRVGVSIVEDGVVEYTSDVAVGSDEILNSLGGEKANTLKEELNKLLIYWFTRKKDTVSNRKIENVILSGGNARSPEIVDFLERHLKINVDVANVWTNCFSTDKYIPVMDQKTALEYSVAIGLAIKSIEYA